jgi:hypothetical protein
MADWQVFFNEKETEFACSRSHVRAVEPAMQRVGELF